MANKKTQSRKNKKQVEVKESVKDMFVAAAQSTTFTEEDVKELETVKEEKVVETPVEENNEVAEAVNDESVKEGVTEASEKTEEAVEETEVSDEPLPEFETAEDIIAETVIEPEPVVETVEEKPKKKRTTAKEAYGYHWMGLIYDE